LQHATHALCHFLERQTLILGDGKFPAHVNGVLLIRFDSSKENGQPILRQITCRKLPYPGARFPINFVASDIFQLASLASPPRTVPALGVECVPNGVFCSNCLQILAGACHLANSVFIVRQVNDNVP
jgi:hypothetical protein